MLSEGALFANGKTGRKHRKKKKKDKGGMPAADYKVFVPGKEDRLLHPFPSRNQQPLPSPAGPGSYETTGRDRFGTTTITRMSVGFARSGRILDNVLLSHNESPGPVYMPRESRLLAGTRQVPPDLPLRPRVLLP